MAKQLNLVPFSFDTSYYYRNKSLVV